MSAGRSGGRPGVLPRVLWQGHYRSMLHLADRAQGPGAPSLESAGHHKYLATPAETGVGKAWQWTVTVHCHPSSFKEPGLHQRHAQARAFRHSESVRPPYTSVKAPHTQFSPYCDKDRQHSPLTDEDGNRRLCSPVPNIFSALLSGASTD